MKKINRTAAATLLLTAAAGASGADVSYTFDSISRIDLHKAQPSVTGVLQNTTTPTTVTFTDNTNGDFRYAVSRCVPIFLTMMEKPGRYLLNLTVDPASTTVGIVSCGLQLKS